MNIAFFTNNYPCYGGVEKVTTVLANQFAKKGHSVSIISFNVIDESLFRELSEEVKYLKLEHPIFQKSNYRKLRKYIDEEGIDFIINQWSLPFYVTIFLKSAISNKACKLISVCHNAPNKNSKIENCAIRFRNSKNLFGKIYFKILGLFVNFASSLSYRYVYFKSDYVVLLSKSFIKVFQNFTQISESSKLRVIAYPITISSEEESVLELVEKKEKIILYVGRIDENQKKISRVLEVWKILYRELPDWKLMIVGDGPDLEDIKSKAKNLDRIYFEGFKDPTYYYQKSSIIVLTSEYEGFGLVILEAMRFGTVPAVYGSYEAIYDIINNGEDGIIIEPPFNAQKFCQEIISYIDSGKDFSSNCISSSEKFKIDKILNMWEKLFLETYNHE